MFDAKRLLDQLVGGLGTQQGQQPGQAGQQAGGFGMGSLGDLAKGALGGSLGGVGGGALAGGLAAILLGTKTGRKIGGTALQYGGMALLGGLAYKAYQDWQAGRAPGASQLGAAQPTASPPGPWGAAPALPAPAGTPFNPTGEEEQQALGRGLLRAMIAAAKADGHIDATEQAQVFAAMDKLPLDAEGKAFVMDELRAPLDIDAVARGARSPEQAAEIYTASLLAIDVDNAAERGYLAMLAQRLKLEDALVAHLHATVEGATSARS